MSTTIFPRVFVLTFAIALGALSQPITAAEPSGDASKLVPLKTDAPKPLFVGTPKNIKASPNMEKYSEKAPAPLMVPEGCTNLALKAKVTSSDASPIIGELSLATDGDKDGGDGSFVELAPGKQWLQVDLGKSADLYAVVIWHYHAEGRVYHSVVVQVSDDADFTKGVKTVFNADYANALGLGAGKNLEYIDDYRGKAIDIRDAKGQPAHGRYVRFWSNGNTSNDQNHYIEVEVFGK